MVCKNLDLMLGFKSMFSVYIIVMSVLTRLSLAQIKFTPETSATHNHYKVNTALSRRDIAIDVSDYGCGAQVFCNSSLAKYEIQHCYDCMKCKCDDICSFYGDCCPDRLFDERTDLPIPPSPYISCLGQHLRSATSGDNPYMFLVTSCPGDSTVDLVTKSKCEQPSLSNFKESTPVSVKSTKINYRNVYCAICHHQSGYVEWRHEVKCLKTDFLSSVREKDELWSYVIKEKSCSIKNIPPDNINVRTCYSGLQDQCNSTGRWEIPNERIEELCHQYYSPVKSTLNFLLYRNIFCSLCDGHKLSRKVVCNKHTVLPDLPEKTAPLSVLIDFNPKPRLMPTPPTTEVTLRKCNDTELYDPISKSCRPAQCSSGRLLSDGECELILGTLAGVGYSGSMALTFSEDMSLTQWRELLKEYHRYLRSALQQYNPFMFSRVDQTLYTTQHTAQDNALTRTQVNGAVLEFDFVSTSAKHIVGFQDIFRNLHSGKSNFTIDNTTGTLTTSPVPCLSDLNKVLEGHPERSSIKADPLLSVCEFNICDLSAVIYRPILHILDCPHLEFRLSEYKLTLNYENSSIDISNQTIHLAESQYWICDDVIKICSSELSRIDKLISKSPPKEPPSVVSASPAMTILSLVCIVLSLLCLLLTFIVYCLLPQLRTLPGKNTMVLVVYLFLAQLFFQIGIRLTYNTNLCTAMGVLIHYLWIAAFMSMATCAFHMYTVFTRMSAKSFHNRLTETKKLIRYIVISNGTAALVIGVCIGYHAGVSRGTEIGYGGDICFLNSPEDIGIFFAAPLGLVLVFNVYCFIRIAFSIRKAPNMKTTKNQTNRNHATVYFRLSILLGFTWIFGFIAAVLQLEFLWYIFLILNGLQGVFIFIAYCVNQRILEMLKSQCRGVDSDKYRSSGQGNTPVASTNTCSL